MTTFASIRVVGVVRRIHARIARWGRAIASGKVRKRNVSRASFPDGRNVLSQLKYEVLLEKPFFARVNRQEPEPGFYPQAHVPVQCAETGTLLDFNLLDRTIGIHRHDHRHSALLPLFERGP